MDVKNIPIEERKIICSKGGKASGEAKRRRKQARQILSDVMAASFQNPKMLDDFIKAGILPENTKAITIEQALVCRAVQRAIVSGNTQLLLELLNRNMGKVRDEVDVSIDSPVVNIDLSDDELRSIALGNVVDLPPATQE